MARSSVPGGVLSAMGTPLRVGLCMGLLVVAWLAVGSVAAQGPGEPASANVEVTVWRRISNPAQLYVSTRPEGGSWRTLNTALDMSQRSASGRFHQSNAVTVSVPVGDQTANVEVTVWRRIANPAQLYVSTRPEGGSWRTLNTALDMSRRSDSGRFHQSNAVLVEVPFPETAPGEPPGVIHFSPEVTESQRERFTNDVRNAEQLLADRFGVEQDPYTLYAAEDWMDLYDLLTEHGLTPYFPRDQASGACPFISNLILINRNCALDPKTAGYSVANAAIQTARLTTPLDLDLRFGFLAYVGFSTLGPEQEADAIAATIAEARAFAVPLAETHNSEIRLDTRPLQFLTIIYLSETFGDQNLFKYFESLSDGNTTETALQHAFGLSLEEFHENFESYRHTASPPIASESERIILLGEDALEKADEIRQIVSTVEQWFEERFTYPAGNAVWRVDSQDSGCGRTVSTALWIGEPCILAATAYAHEYFHLLQLDWGTPEGEGYGSARSYPPFMREGSAAYIHARYRADASGRAWSDIRADIVTAVRDLEIALDDPTFRIHPSLPEYTLGALAAEWLEARSGKSVADYYYALSQQELRAEDGDRRFDLAGERAFREFWGITSEEFYRQFACWREQGFPIAEVGKECVTP